jgi:UPF0755 protein
VFEMTLKRYVRLGIFLIILLACGVFAFFFVNYYSNPGPLQTQKIVFIEKGSGLAAITQQLGKEGVIDYPVFLEAHLRLRQLSHHVRAGEFEFQPHISPEQVYETLSTGPVVQHSITVPEGLRSKDIVHLVIDSPLLLKDSPLDVKEGELLPETYHYTWNEPSTVLVDRMKRSMKDVLERAWHEHKAGHILQSPEALLIMASIVEKETGLASERPRVAAVFLNRLRKGMMLQSDPTVIYGLEYEHNRPNAELSKADLQTPSRYNTYLNRGLPPTPICNPGKASIEAVMKPMETEDLYFVADGTGGHEFSKTYEEHMQHHKKWRKIRAGED